MIPGEFSSLQPGNGERGVLLIHDLCGSPDQMHSLSHVLHENGYTVSVPLLPGHGATLHDIQKFSSLDWLTCVRMACAVLREQCARVSVIGYSMGGVLALLLAEESPLDAIVTISAPMRPANPASLLFFRAVPAKECNVFSKAPLSSIRQFYRLMNRARRNLFAVTAPVFAMQTSDEPLLSASNLKIILSGVSSSVRQELLLDRPDRFIQHDSELSQFSDAILDFLSQNT